MANQTKGGKKRTWSALVVVGNGNGMAGGCGLANNIPVGQTVVLWECRFCCRSWGGAEGCHQKGMESELIIFQFTLSLSL